jgi:cysteine sulfinate desulfinase/cysteine desulfurase-like protein
MLDPSADEIRAWGNSVIQLMSDYLRTLRDRGVDWIRQILGFNAEAGGLFVSGGSMANLAAIAAARQAKDPSSGRLRIYASSETHFSIGKAAVLLGIGQENMRQVAVDERFKIRVDDLVAKISADLEAGYVPFCVVANAGTVNTGAVDPLTDIREITSKMQRSKETAAYDATSQSVACDSAAPYVRGHHAHLVCVVVNLRFSNHRRRACGRFSH